MRRVLRILMALMAVMAFAAVPVASAKPPAVLAPPGDSAISQYVEVVPTDTGAKPTGSSPTHGAALPAAETHQLDRLGTDGRVLASVVDSTAPTSQAGPVQGQPARGGQGASTRGASGGAGALQSAAVLSDLHRRNALSLILSAAGGAGGLGALLPALLVAGLLAVILRAAVLRRPSS